MVTAIIQIQDGKIIPKGCHSELLKRTALPVPCQIRFMLGVVLRATEALLALRFPGFSRFERSQDESVMDLVLGGVLEASWSDVGRLLGGPRWPKMAPRRAQDAPRRAQDAPRCAKRTPRWAKDAPRGRQDAPRRAQDAPKRPPRAPTTPMRASVGRFCVEN